MANGMRDRLDAVEHNARMQATAENERLMAENGRLKAEIQHLNGTVDRLRSERNKYHNDAQAFHSKLRMAEVDAKQTGVGFRAKVTDALLEASRQTLISDCPQLRQLIQTALEEDAELQRATDLVQRNVHNGKLRFQDLQFSLQEIGLFARVEPNPHELPEGSGLDGGDE